MPDDTNVEKEQQKEIVLPADLTHAFGAYLEQEFGPQLQEIDQSIINLPKNSKGVIDMEQGRDKIINFLRDFRTSKKVTLEIKNGGYALGFSEEKEEKTPQPGEIITDKTLTPRFLEALQHRLRNTLSPLVGYSEILKNEKIHNASLRMLATLSPMVSAERLRIITDSVGLTTVTPISSEANLK